MSTSPRTDSEFERLFREGTRLLQAGKAEKARRRLEQAHALQPDHVDAALNLSGALILTRKFRRAVPLLEGLVKAQPENPMVWTNLGAAYLGNPVLASDKMQREAIKAFERALALDPAAPNVAYNIGLIYRDRQEVERAIHWFQRALQTNPSDRDARRILGRLQSKHKADKTSSSESPPP